jgi:uncharacterized protein YdeI (YjbR/CyaY-like superfamily)
MKKTARELPVVLFADAAAFDTWLDENHAGSPGLWLRIAKKKAALRSITYPEAVEVALCHGWIDSQLKKFDDESFIQKFTPRGARSIWSKINRARVDGLIDAGRMKAAGLAEVERAKTDGRWAQAYDSARTATVPEDLQAAFDASATAGRAFAALDAANRYAVLFRVQTARTPATRATRIAALVAMLEQGGRIHG